MESYQQQQSHSYTRPPLPPPPPPPAAAPISDHPLQYHHRQIPPQQQPPPPGQQPTYQQQQQQQSSAYPNQFQYNPSPPSSSSSPLPPPPQPPHHHQYPPPPHQHQQHQQQWNNAPHPPPPVYPDQYPPGVYHPYPTHHNYPPQPQPHLQSYPRPNQEWGSPNWPHHQGTEYHQPVQSNEDDWAARAKAWASGQVSTDYQSVQPRPSPYGKVDEQVQHHDQHQQPVESQYSQSQQQTHATSGYQFPATPTHRLTSIGSGSASYVLPGASNGEGFTVSQPYQQEVPSSYSSVGGKPGAGEQGDLLYEPSSFPMASHQEGHYLHQSSSAMARPEMVEGSFANRNYTADHHTVLSDQPLDFAPRFNHTHEYQKQSIFSQHNRSEPLGGLDPVTTAPPIHTWHPPHAPETVYHSIPLGSQPQHDTPLALTSSNTLFGRTTGPGFHPSVSAVSAPFDLGVRPALYSTTAFPGEAYGVSSISDRPKKAAVPNWLREEIIKKKAVFVNSAHEKNDDVYFVEDEEAVEKSIRKSDQEDSKSIESSKSIEEEEEEEDYVEAARTIAINQEIKRILTEVLLKVTDDLFDEIATKVLDEDDVMADVNQDVPTSSFPATTPTPKASAKVLSPVKPVESEARVTALKYRSNTPGDILGLGSYESDDEDGDDKIPTSLEPKSKEESADQHSGIKIYSEDILDADVVAGSQANTKVQDRYQYIEHVSNKGIEAGFKTRTSAGKELINVNSKSFSEEASGVSGDASSIVEKMVGDVGVTKIKDKAGERILMKSEILGKEVNTKNSVIDSRIRETSTKLEKNGSCETKLNPAVKESVREGDRNKIAKNAEKVENRVKRDESRIEKDKIDDHNGFKGKKKEEGASTAKKLKEPYSRGKKDVESDTKDDRYEAERGKKTRDKGDHDKKREHGKEEMSRHKSQSSSSKHKRRRSPPAEGNGRHRRDNSAVSHSDSSSDEASGDSRRKSRSKRRYLSPSPVRSRKRQVSRSPLSKHSQRRHSPYSSLENTRKRRSRSRSPTRRR